MNDSPKVPIYESGSEAVSKAYKSDGLLSYASYVKDLLDMGHPILIAAGEFDMQDGAKT
jgi:hypothetical protein